MVEIEIKKDELSPKSSQTKKAIQTKEVQTKMDKSDSKLAKKLDPAMVKNSNSKLAKAKQAKSVDLKTRSDVIQFEVNNYSYVVFYKSGGQFFNAISHSCLFMINLFGSKAKVHFLGDNLKTSLPYISYNNAQFTELKSALSESGYKIKEHKFCVYFRLKNSSNPEQIKLWKKSESFAIGEMEKLYKPPAGWSKLYTLLCELSSQILFTSNKMTQGARILCGQELFQTALDMHKKYLLLQTDERNKTSILCDFGFLTYQVSYLTQVAFNAGVIKNIGSVNRIGRTLADIRACLN
ncbi:MAG: hypothetical protein LBT85_01105 [Bifidobacteriaceae bacterium]|jgi:hypothetical protein|nr:hypothetical protein [Bifidobacteriaceae bacterium]